MALVGEMPMETRKVQVTGGSTFVISLPKKWARAAGVKPNDTLGIIQQDDGTLVVTPNLVEAESTRTKTFEIGETPMGEELFRNLIAAYVTGYDVIEVVQRPRMSANIRNVVRTFCHAVIGPEIIDESAEVIRTRDLLDPSDLPFRTSLQRMYRIASGMHSSAATACAELDIHLAEDVVSRDAEVDRLNWLIARQYNLLLRDIRLAERMGTPREQAIVFLLISRTLERIGDHAGRIAEQVPALKRAGAEPKLMAPVTKHSEVVMKILDDSMAALLTKDSRQAHECIRRAATFLTDLERLSSRMTGLPGGVAVPMGAVLDSLGRTGAYTKDVGELVINFLVGTDGSAGKG